MLRFRLSAHVNCCAPPSSLPFVLLFFICDTECALLQIRKSKQIQKLATNRRLSSGVGHHSPQTSLSPDRVALSILKKKLAINLLYEAYSISDMIWAQGCQPTSNFCCTCCAFIFEIRFFGCVMAFSQNNTHTFFVSVVSRIKATAKWVPLSRHTSVENPHSRVASACFAILGRPNSRRVCASELSSPRQKVFAFRVRVRLGLGLASVFG